jgi:hypothetical protein
MTDEKLLELAAKADGKFIYVEDIGWIDCTDGINGNWWNPLENDGDALRLAVKLKLQLLIIGLMDDEIMAYALEPEDVEAWEKMGKDPYAATRRAIVRAAAKIGEEMK